MKKETQSDKKRLITVNEALESIPLGRTAFYAALRRGDVPGVVRIGRRIFIKAEALDRMLTHS